MVTDEMAALAKIAEYLKLRDENLTPGDADDAERAESAREIFALTAALAARPVRVKALEWEEISEHEPGWWAAQDDNLPLGYEVRIYSRGEVRSRFPGKTWGTFDGTPDEAKAAAQADYEARILSALEDGQ